jgi:electron-transferring-flavoprotein dehydrogenase
MYLGPCRRIRLPNVLMPKLMNNHGNYIGSLGNVCPLARRKAEALGVEIYPGFAAAGALQRGRRGGGRRHRRHGHREATATNGPGFTRGMELRGKYVLIGEGARGSLAKQMIAASIFQGPRAQKYGIGIKELWQVKPEKFTGRASCSIPSAGRSNEDRRRLVPLPFRRQPRGRRLRRPPQLQEPLSLALRRVPALQDPPDDARHLRGRQALGYGARAITEGGWQSVPKLSFPGGALMGCSAGFVNVPRIKGSHNAILSGMLCGRACRAAMRRGRANDEIILRESWRSPTSARTSSGCATSSRSGRNSAPALGVGLGGLDMWLNQLFGWSPFGTLKHGKPI